jgi:hypothetical protein
MRTQKTLGTIIQAGWWMLTGLSVIFFVYAIPTYFGQLTQVCFKSPCLAMQLTIGRAIVVELSGLDFQRYAQIIVAIEILVYLVYFSIGVFIYSRKPHDSLAILVSLLLITTLQADLHRGLQHAYPASIWPVFMFGAINSLLLVVFFYIFPTGSFRPRWTIALAILWIVALLSGSLFPALSLAPRNQPGQLFALFLAALVISSLAVMVYRYRNIFTPLQKIQSKWVVLGVALTWGGEVFFELLRLATPIFEQDALWLISWNIVVLIWTLILPVSILVAVLSAALLNIDVLIRRTLAYSLLTVTLLALYIGLVMLLQKIFELVTGQSSSFVSIISTLVIAALARPLRQRFQANIDRIFFRKHYDLERAVQGFNSAVREDVNLEEISGQFVDIVRTALQPEFSSLWLCKTAGSRPARDE